MTPEREKFYENATRKLVAIADKMQFPSRIQNMRLKNLTLLFRDSYKIPEVQAYIAKHLTNTGGGYSELTYAATGFCKTTKCVYILAGGADVWTLMYIPESWQAGPHYFLRKKDSGEIFDITFDQYAYQKIEIPYDKGIPLSEVPFSPDDVALSFSEKLGIDLIAAMKEQKQAV